MKLHDKGILGKRDKLMKERKGKLKCKTSKSVEKKSMTHYLTARRPPPPPDPTSLSQSSPSFITPSGSGSLSKNLHIETDRQTDLNLMKKQLKNLSVNVLEERIIQRECRAIVSEMAEVLVVIVQKALMET